MLTGLLIFLLMCQPAMNSVSLNSYYENDLIGISKGGGGGAWGDVNRLRLKFDYKRSDILALHFEPRYYFMIKPEELPIIGVTDLNQLVWDRYHLKLYSPVGTLTAGKQRIAWGSGYIWNPTDVFNPVVLSFTVREEDETNVEALRFEVPIGQASGLDGYVTAGPVVKKGFRAKTNIHVFDLSASYVDLGNNDSQLGFDFSGDAWLLSVRGEAAVKRDGIMQVMMGGDYTLENGVGLALEYHYNGLGKKDKVNYDWAGLTAGTIKELGMDYLYLGLNKIVDEITTLKGSLLTNLNDQSFLVYPALTRSLSQNLDLSLESMILGGQQGTEYDPGPGLDPTGFSGSIFGMVRLMWSF